MKKIFVIQSVNQMGNQLYFFAHIISFALKNNFKVINPSFYDYAHFFEGTACGPQVSYPPCKDSYSGKNRLKYLKLQTYFYSLLSYLPFYGFTLRLVLPLVLQRYRYGRLINKLVLKHREVYFDKKRYNEKFRLVKQEMERSKTIFISGFYFTSENLVLYRKELQSYFTIKAEYRQKPEKIINAIKKDGVIIIGIHIRRADYEYWKNGKYFFNDQQYLAVMQKTSLILQGEIQFIIVTNSPLNKTNFNKFNAIFPEGSMIEDLHLLSLCDYIIGPPSSYSDWASLIGCKPKYTIEDPDTDFSLLDFHVAGENRIFNI